MDDYRTDYKLYTTCKDDVKNLCDVDPGDSREMECLVSGSGRVEDPGQWGCLSSADSALSTQQCTVQH